MSSAIGFAAIVLVFALFMPDVLNALQMFLLTLLQKVTGIIQSLPTSMPVEATSRSILP